MLFILSIVILTSYSMSMNAMEENKIDNNITQWNYDTHLSVSPEVIRFTTNIFYTPIIRQNLFTQDDPAATRAETLIDLLKRKELPTNFSYIEYLCDIHRHQQYGDQNISKSIYKFAQYYEQINSIDNEELIRLVGYIKLGGRFDEYYLGKINFKKKNYKKAADFWLAYAINKPNSASAVIPKLNFMVKKKRLPHDYKQFIEDVTCNIISQKTCLIKEIIVHD